jgi:hypothetical protein
LLARIASPVAGVVNPEKPQSKHTKTFGHTKALGLSRFLTPWKWMLISAVNSAKLVDAHEEQDIDGLPAS